MGIECPFLGPLLLSVFTISNELFGLRLNYRLHTFTDLFVVVASLNVQWNHSTEIYKYVFSRQDEEIS
jgi:hypothetical protein